MILFSRLFTFYDGMKMRDILELNESFGGGGKEFKFFLSKSNFDTGKDVEIAV